MKDLNAAELLVSEADESVSERELYYPEGAAGEEDARDEDLRVKENDGAGGGENDFATMESEVEQSVPIRGREELRRELALRSAVRALQRSERAQQMAAREAFVRMDAQDFQRKHPEVDLAKLDNNPGFLRFCGSRYGVEPLTGLYEDYREIVGGAENAGRAVAESRSRRSTGSGGGGGDVLTAQQRASLEAWNRANPDMKMSAREFLKN